MTWSDCFSLITCGTWRNKNVFTKEFEGNVKTIDPSRNKARVAQKILGKRSNTAGPSYTLSILRAPQPFSSHSETNSHTDYGGELHSGHSCLRAH